MASRWSVTVEHPYTVEILPDNPFGLHPRTRPPVGLGDSCTECETHLARRAAGPGGIRGVPPSARASVLRAVARVSPSRPLTGSLHDVPHRPFRFGVTGRGDSLAQWREFACKAEDLGYSTLLLP